jgi:hypothetical protein
MDIKNLIIWILGLIVGIGIALGVMAVKPASHSLGALAGPDIPYDHVCIGGVCTYSYKAAINASSSMPCSFPFPNAGTSSVTYAAIQVTGNGLGTQTLDISTSSNPYGTSSLPFVKARSIAGFASIAWEPGATSSAQLSGVNSATGELNTLGTSTDFLNFKVATATPGTFTNYYTGTCIASFRALQ